MHEYGFCNYTCVLLYKLASHMAQKRGKYDVVTVACYMPDTTYIYDELEWVAADWSW